MRTPLSVNDRRFGRLHKCKANPKDTINKAMYKLVSRTRNAVETCGIL